MNPFAQLDWAEVRTHYDHRVATHKKLLRLWHANSTSPFVSLLLGITDAAGNYSAAEHALGPKILGSNANAAQRVFILAGQFSNLKSPHDVPGLVRSAGLAFLKIGVGSEASCMMNPATCWVSNTRTIWTHLLIKHADKYSRADEELALYRDEDATSEMAYQIWSKIHREMDTAMTRIAERADDLCKKAGVIPGSEKYLWADAVANALYADHFG